jgi:hypothetical protein
VHPSWSYRFRSPLAGIGQLALGLPVKPVEGTTMAKTVFPNIKLLHDISLSDGFWRSRISNSEAEYYFYWYCSLLQEDNEHGMMVCDRDEFLAGAYNVMLLSHNRLAHA